MEAQEQQKSGAGKWIACGCGCVVLLLAAIGGCSWVGLSQFRKMGGLPEVVESLSKHPEVQEQLGTPLTYSFIPSGNVQVTGHTGTADFTFNVTGPKGAASVVYSAVLEGGDWVPTHLRVTLPDRTVLNPLEEEPEADADASIGTPPEPVDPPDAEEEAEASIGTSPDPVDEAEAEDDDVDGGNGTPDDEPSGEATDPEAEPAAPETGEEEEAEVEEAA